MYEVTFLITLLLSLNASWTLLREAVSLERLKKLVMDLFYISRCNIKTIYW